MTRRQPTELSTGRATGSTPSAVNDSGEDRRFVATARVVNQGAGIADEAAASPVREEGQPTYLRFGRLAWATLGIVGVLIVVGFVVGRVALLVIPLVLALFPAALLMPVAKWLKERGVPASVASVLTILGALGLVVGLFAAVTPLVAGQLPGLVDSVGAGVDQLEAWLTDDPLGVGLEINGFSQLIEEGREQLGTVGADLAGGAMTALIAAVEGVTALLLLIVALFFYLKDDGKLARGVIRTMPASWRQDATALGDRFWMTTGNYFRGQLLVALIDAVFIGIGLVLLGIPLAVPLAILVFFGALFPIVGAVVSGSAAVLVALADAGPLTALAVIGLVVAVQQAEGNILQPLILSRAIRLHPLVVLASIVIGSILLGILGAFLAVPVAASIARAIDYLRGEEDREETGERADDPEELVEADT